MPDKEFISRVAPAFNPAPKGKSKDVLELIRKAGFVECADAVTPGIVEYLSK